MMLRTENGGEVVNRHGNNNPEKTDELKDSRYMGKMGEWRFRSSDSGKGMEEWEIMKQQLSNLKLEIAAVMEEKTVAESQKMSALMKMESGLSSVEVLSREIEEINEEQVLVELAKIEAVKEHEQIEGQRRKHAARYSAAIAETRKKTLRMVRQIKGNSKKQEMLNAAMADISMLQNELTGIRKMQEVGKSELDSESKLLAEAVIQEMEDTTKKLAAVTEEKLQYIASMDALRHELNKFRKERTRIRKKEEDTEMKIQNLTAKLLSVNAKLEATSAAEAKTKFVLSNLRLSHEQLKSKAEMAKEDCSRINEETRNNKEEIQQIENEVELGDQLLQFTLRELQVVKLSEAKALDDLEVLSKKTARNRASIYSPTITISKFEYEYLKRGAAEAVAIADKKVAVAQAWAIAVKASEKEIQLKTESIRREMKQLRMENKFEDDKELTETKSAIANALVKWEGRIEAVNNSIRASSKEMSRSSKLIPRHMKGKKSTSFTVTRRAKLMPNLGKVFRVGAS